MAAQGEATHTAGSARGRATTLSSSWKACTIVPPTSIRLRAWNNSNISELEMGSQREAHISVREDCAVYACEGLHGSVEMRCSLCCGLLLHVALALAALEEVDDGRAPGRLRRTAFIRGGVARTPRPPGLGWAVALMLIHLPLVRAGVVKQVVPLDGAGLGQVDGGLGSRAVLKGSIAPDLLEFTVQSQVGVGQLQSLCTERAVRAAEPCGRGGEVRVTRGQTY